MHVLIIRIIVRVELEVSPLRFYARHADIPRVVAQRTVEPDIACGKLNRYTGYALKYAVLGASKSRVTSPTQNRDDVRPILVILDQRVGVNQRCNYCTIYNSLNLGDPCPWIAT